ncbi:MAG TPA: DUF4139 domain-containing protein [Bacteroidales bacterium]|nr:DUF4139 domain-containing protein [Bacteroidales bacterium]
MKNILILILTVILYPATILAQKENLISLNPQLNDVIIYMAGAQMRYKVNVNLVKGRNTVVLENLAPALNPASIRIRSDEDITVLSISHKVNSSLVESENQKHILINDSITLITKKITAVNDEKNALTTQKEMLLKNQSLGGQSTGVNVTELQKAADFFQLRIYDINKRLSELTADSDANATLLSRLQVRANEINSKLKTSRSEVSLLIIANTTQAATLDVSYVVKDAGWMPYYDLKCEDISKPIILNYRAKAYNNSGIDWNDVALTLSTTDPALNITVPELKTWYLTNYVSQVKYDKSGFYNQEVITDQEYDQKFKGENKVQQQSVKIKQIEVPELSFDFNIKNRYTLPSDAQPYIIDIEEHSVSAGYRYICVPVVEKSAFLMACINDWEELNLVEGYANVYLNGTYVGQSYINPNEISDTLQISLGRDSRIQVDRVKLKDYSSRMLIGTKRKATYVYELTLKNNHATPVVIEIQDQIPVSNSQEIEVTIDEISGAEHNPLTGFLKWNFSIDPGKVLSLKTGYTVKYPKNYSIPMKKMRAQSCPSF